MTACWLHVSDFHFKSGDAYDQDVVLRALVRSVAEFRRNGRQPDLIIATGDVAHRGQESEYRAATKFFHELCAAAGVDKRRLYVVPGNHDIDRALGVGLVRTMETREEADVYFGPSFPKPHITQKQRAFQHWYDQFFDGIRLFPKTSTCGPLEVVDIGSLTVGILPVNSALFRQGDDDHAKLWVGRRCLDAAVEELNTLGPALKIALVHHPLDWLHEAERSNVRTALQSNVDIILRGHLHETDVEAVAGVMGGALHMAAGAAYQTRRWPNRALYASVHDHRIEVFPIRYEDQPREIWTVDPSVFPEPPHTRTFAIPRVIGHSPSLSGIHIGENLAAVSRIGIPPTAKNQIGPQTIIKWRFPLRDELSVTAMIDTGKIVYIEYDWGGNSRTSLTDFPNFQFGTTTLTEIREKLGSNGFTFDKNPAGPFPDGIVLSNGYEIIDTDAIVIFVTKIWFQDNPKDDLLTIANYAKLVAIILADGTYLRRTWGKISADPAYRPIYWK
jgi:3',5'-cyclic AMP phosphodiesterase CpdA